MLEPEPRFAPNPDSPNLLFPAISSIEGVSKKSDAITRRACPADPQACASHRAHLTSIRFFLALSSRACQSRRFLPSCHSLKQGARSLSESLDRPAWTCFWLARPGSPIDTGASSKLACSPSSLRPSLSTCSRSSRATPVLTFVPSNQPACHRSTLPPQDGPAAGHLWLFAAGETRGSKTIREARHPPPQRMIEPPRRHRSSLHPFAELHPSISLSAPSRDGPASIQCPA